MKHLAYALWLTAMLSISSTQFAATEEVRLTRDGYGTISFDVPADWTHFSTTTLHKHGNVFHEFFSPNTATPTNWDKMIVVIFGMGQMPAERLYVGVARSFLRNSARLCFPVRTPGNRNLHKEMGSLQGRPEADGILIADIGLQCAVSQFNLPRVPDLMSSRNQFKGNEILAGSVFGLRGREGLVAFLYYERFGDFLQSQTGDDARREAAFRNASQFVKSSVSYCAGKSEPSLCR